MKIKLLLLIILGIGLIAFRKWNTNSKQKLVIYSPHGKELLGEFKRLYEAKNPQVEIEWLDMGSQEIFDRISTESHAPEADIWWGAPSTMFMSAERLGLLQPYRPTWADKVPDYAKSKHNCWFGTFSTPEVFAFNSNKMDAADVPADWGDLAKKRCKDKIVLRNPMASGTMRTIFCAMVQQSISRTGSETSGWEWLTQLDKNTKEYTADATQMYAELGGQNDAITLWNMPDIELQRNKYRLPVGYVFPSSGTVVVTDGIAIVKGTKHPELAKSFYEFVTSQESLLLQAKNYYRIPSRTDLDKDKLPEWLKKCNYKVLDVDWEILSQKEASWMQHWDTQIKEGVK